VKITVALLPVAHIAPSSVEPLYATQSGRVEKHACDARIPKQIRFPVQSTTYLIFDFRQALFRVSPSPSSGIHQLCRQIYTSHSFSVYPAPSLLRLSL
jgi:hypothetical protein